MVKNLLAGFGAVCGCVLTFVVGWACGVVQQQENSDLADKLTNTGDEIIKSFGA